MTTDRNMKGTESIKGFDDICTKEGTATMASKVTEEETHNSLNSLRMLGVILEARLDRKVTVSFPGTDDVPTLGELLLGEPTEDEWPADEIHLYITHEDDLYGMAGDLTITELLGHTRLAEAVVDLPSVHLPPALTSLAPNNEPDHKSGAVIWMISAESADEYLERKTLVANVSERTCPGIRKGLAAGPTGEGFQHVKDLLVELLVAKRAVDGVSCKVDVAEAQKRGLSYSDCKDMAS